MYENILSILITNNDNDLQIGVVKKGEESMIYASEEQVNNVKESIDALFSLSEKMLTPKEKAEEEKEKLIDIINDKTTDEEKLQFKDIYDEWKPNIELKMDTILRRNDTLYRVIKNLGAGNNLDIYPPESTPSLYEDLSKKTPQADGTPPQWVQPLGAHDAYKLGDIVQDEGFVWECTQGIPGSNNTTINTWKPAQYGWKKLGTVEEYMKGLNA